MKRIFFILFLVAFQIHSYANNDLIENMIECYREYFSFSEETENQINSSEKKNVCMPEPPNFYDYFKTDFIDFASLRGADVSAFSFRDSLHSPLKQNLIVTSNYGNRKGQKHFGVDFKLAEGDTVCSVFCGKVRVIKYDETYGRVVVVRHYNMSESVYAHLSKVIVKVGEELVVGAPIGLGGNTGRSTGAHLHFELRYEGYPINPIVENKFLKTIAIKALP